MSRPAQRLAFTFFLFVAGCAANDWYVYATTHVSLSYPLFRSTPCFDGHCSYDIPASSEVSGTLRIVRESAILCTPGSNQYHLQKWGAADAISDITPAAGWTILDCEKGAMAQDVRLVCHDSAGCPHLAQNTGSVGKLVRLPESVCGSIPLWHTCIRKG
jgi:hypothetical protein